MLELFVLFFFFTVFGIKQESVVVCSAAVSPPAAAFSLSLLSLRSCRQAPPIAATVQSDLRAAVRFSATILRPSDGGIHTVDHNRRLIGRFEATLSSFIRVKLVSPQCYVYAAAITIIEMPMLPNKKLKLSHLATDKCSIN